MAKLTLSRRPQATTTALPNPLPQLLQTPSGLALLEIQGTINFPSISDISTFSSSNSSGGPVYETPIGRLVFPDYEPQNEDKEWMKRVYLYVGRHQRLTGEVKKLGRAMAVFRRVKGEHGEEGEGEGDGERGELEIVEIVKWKILFAMRPEPVGTQVLSS